MVTNNFWSLDYTEAWLKIAELIDEGGFLQFGGCSVAGEVASNRDRKTRERSRKCGDCRQTAGSGGESAQKLANKLRREIRASPTDNDFKFYYPDGFLPTGGVPVSVFKPE